MDHIIYVNGTANPEQITSDDIQDMRTDLKYTVRKFKGQQSQIKDLTLPSKYEAKFIWQETTPYLYARHYLATFTVPEYPDEEMHYLISLVKSIVRPNITVHVRCYDHPYLPGDRESDDVLRPIRDAEERFIKLHFVAKLCHMFPFLTDEQVENAFIILRSQMRERTELDDDAFITLLHHVGIPDDVFVDLFKNMVADMNLNVSALGIDMTEDPSATVHWTC